MPPPATIEGYLAALPDVRRRGLEQLRAAARAGAPDAQESIAYGIPTLRVGGRLLVSYAAFKAHYSLFPASQVVIDALGAEVASHVAGKGTLRFAASEPLPTDLITRIVRVRVRELAGEVS